MAKFAEPVKRELPSNFCHRCRRWVESQEVVRVFVERPEGGDELRPPVWTCPECRGEAPKGTAVEAREITQSDISKDERLGPYRAVVEILKVNPSGVTARGRLACGHEVCVLPDAKKARCRKCRAGGNTEHLPEETK